MPMSYLQVENVCKVYGQGEQQVKALSDVSFALENGRLVVILGFFGAGKTTLLNMLGGTKEATSAKNPKMLLCDEPTGASDDKTGKKIFRLL